MGILENKNAIIYGGGGDIGGAAARAFAREGARVFLVGRTQAKLDAVAADTGAETAVLDALDAAAVDAHAASVGRVDISMNVITHPYTHQVSWLDIDADDYFAPVEVAVRSTFLTARAAARQMVQQDDGGVILSFGGTGTPPKDYLMGGTMVAFDAVESMRRSLSAELGRQGVRWITLLSGGVASEDLPAEINDGLAAGTLTGRTATLEDVGNAAAFAASDRARSMTAATLNISHGAIVDF